jgi:hypothetical protein
LKDAWGFHKDFLASEIRAAGRGLIEVPGWHLPDACPLGNVGLVGGDALSSPASMAGRDRRLEFSKEARFGLSSSSVKPQAKDVMDALSSPLSAFAVLRWLSSEPVGIAVLVSPTSSLF